jgi:hypothetical protein
MEFFDLLPGRPEGGQFASKSFVGITTVALRRSTLMMGRSSERRGVDELGSSETILSHCEIRYVGVRRSGEPARR